MSVAAASVTHFDIVPRSNLDFGLASDNIPRHWLAGDPFKTRFFDAMSTLFPDGERFFIQCVRDFRERITDPDLQAQVKDFIFQEAQHGKVHTDFNDRLHRQGIDVPQIVEGQLKILGWYRKHTSREYTLGITAAAEHMTALMAHFFLENPEVFDNADPRIRAMYFWHAVEEIEHKAVAFDVMRDVAKVGYWKRCLAMLNLSVSFPLHTLMIVRAMLKRDGYTAAERRKIWAKGLWWLYGPGGVYGKMLRHYISYYKPGYHPWDQGETRTFEQWRQAYQANGGDPIAASNQFLGQPA